jgi:hypothetical protein
MSSDLLSQIKATIAAFRTEVESKSDVWAQARSPSTFLNAEKEISAVCRGLADSIASRILKHIVADPSFQAHCSVAARSGAGALRCGDHRDVTITLLGGSTVRLENLEYLKPDRRAKRPGRKRRPGRRGKSGVGLYPVLAALGTWFGVTPALAEEVCRQVADSDSVRCARAALSRRNIDLGHKKTLRIFNEVSTRAVAQRTRWLADVLSGATATLHVLRGRRVVVATDGGRVRERVPARCGRRRDNGHRGFEAPWREPKLLVLYLIDNKGRVLGEFRPIYDGTMEEADEIFEMLAGYLKALGVEEAKQLIFVADGAKWIWNRTGPLAEKLGVPPERFVEVVDWYHAVETLWTIAKVPARWGKKRREQWVRRAKKLLHAGKIAALKEHIEALAVGRRAKEVKKHLDYFVRNEARMQYASFVAANVPCGSGAVESAVRRVINMRMKGNAKFWLEINAASMLLLRSYLKAGRFDDLFRASITEAARWLRGASGGSSQCAPMAEAVGW